MVVNVEATTAVLRRMLSKDEFTRIKHMFRNTASFGKCLDAIQ
jgi:hypothetical protein